MKGVYLSIIFFLLTITSLRAQSESANISAWIEVADLTASKKIEIRGMIKNESDQELTLYQKMEVTKSGSSGTANHQQSGNFTVSSKRTKVLGRSSFYKSNTDSYKVIFRIQNDLGVIFTDSLFYPERPIVVEKKKRKAIEKKKEKLTFENSSVKKEKPIVTAKSNSPVKQDVPDILKKLIPTSKSTKPIVSSKKTKTSVPVDVLEIDGLIIDETRSKIARDFYDLFYKKWIAPKGAKNFSIYIKEEPSRGRGAQISLTLNDQEIFKNFVPPRYDALENVVNFAIRVTRAKLKDRSNIDSQLKEEDQMGSGI